jgi:hypothetical protein
MCRVHHFHLDVLSVWRSDLVGLNLINRDPIGKITKFRSVSHGRYLLCGRKVRAPRSSTYENVPRLDAPRLRSARFRRHRLPLSGAPARHAKPAKPPQQPRASRAEQKPSPQQRCECLTARPFRC